jgi:hypothetical protein
MYTVIAYKPDSDDYCRGCYMASYKSDMQWKDTKDKKEVIDFLSYFFIYNSHYLNTGEHPYEFTYLTNNFDSIIQETQILIKEEIRVIIEQENKEKRENREREQKELTNQEIREFKRLKKKYVK